MYELGPTADLLLLDPNVRSTPLSADSSVLVTPDLKATIKWVFSFQKFEAFAYELVGSAPLTAKDLTTPHPNGDVAA
jgi:hypothetical protein